MARRGIFGNIKKTIFRSTLIKASVGVLVVVSVILIIYFSSATSIFLGNIEENTRYLASAMADSQAEELNSLISKRLSEYISGLSVLDNAKSIEEAAGSLSVYIDSLMKSENVTGIATARYFRDGKEYYSAAIDDSFLYPNQENQLVLELADKGITGVTSAVYEADTRTDKCMAFVIALPNCEFIDSVVLFIKMEVIFSGISAFDDTEEHNFEYACIASVGPL